MAKKALILECAPELQAGRPFIRYFQTKAILLLRARGLLTETQAEHALRLLDRVPE